ncbi:MAG: YihY/virulence factor BrkB family protein [Hyphomicrobiaceae bacterium]|nr:YihY/virulence factor BrkB family protein [Hyphomicrobiaceae bacterium]
MRRRIGTLYRALMRLIDDGGFSMAGAIAFAFLLSLFPFCIFLGALAGTLGGRELAAEAVAQLFQVVPDTVAKALAPEVEKVMGQSQYGLLTVGAGVSLFFATSAIESLRAALNVAYGVREGRSALWCFLQSILFVFATAAGMLAIAWGIVAGPALVAARNWAPGVWLLDHGLLSPVSRYTIVVAVTMAQLFAYHLWLAAGRRSLWDVWPGSLLSVALWILAAWIYSWWLTVSDYSIFYAGLTQLFTALIFFQVSGAIMIFGAEYNRALAEERSGA